MIWAGAFLDYWCFRAMRSRLEPMKKVARMLRAHEPLILNWFRAKGEISSGAVEGLNNESRAAENSRCVHFSFSKRQSQGRTQLPATASEALAEKLGVPALTFQSLGRSFATLMQGKGTRRMSRPKCGTRMS